MPTSKVKEQLYEKDITFLRSKGKKVVVGSKFQAKGL